MFCKKCGSEIEEGGQFCPNCGTPVEAPEQPVPDGAGSISMEKVGDAASQAVETVAQKAQEFGEKGKDAWKKANGEDGILKKVFSGKNLIWMAACAAVLVVAAVCVANASRLNNFLHKTFSSPEKYYQFVEKKTLGDTADLIGGYYGDIVSGMQFYDTSYSGEFTLEPGEDITKLAKLADGLMGLDEIGIDLSELKSLKIGADISIKDNVMGYGLTAALNKVNILSPNIVMDLGQGEMYLQIPELTKTYMGFDMEEYMDDDYDELADLQAANRDALQGLPRQGEVEKLIKRYFTLVLENIDDVSIGRKKELKVGGLSQKCTELKVTIDGDAMEQILEAVLEEAMGDKTLEKIIVGMAEARGEDGDDAYDDFIESLEYRLDHLDYYVDEDNEIKMTLYVDRKGNIIGRVIEQEDYWGDSSFSVLTARKGSKIAYEISYVEYGDDVFEISGQGRKSGDLLTGEFELEIYGQSALGIKVTKLDMKQLVRGYVNGKAEITLSSELSRELSNEIDVSGASSIIKKSSLVIDCKSSAKSIDCNMVINYDGKKFLGMTLNLKSGSGSKTSVPKSNAVIMIEDADDFMDYYDEIDWNKFLDTLEKTGVLADLADKLEDAIDDLRDIRDLMYYYYRF